MSGGASSLLVVVGDIESLPDTATTQVNASARFLGSPTLLHVADGSAADDLVFSATLNGGAAASLRKAGDGRARIATLTGARPIEIQRGELELGSAVGADVTLNGGTLTGASQVGSITSAAGGGIISPGDGVGTIFCSNVTLNPATTFAVQIQSDTPGNADLLDANLGTVNLGGATLSLQLPPSFVGSIGVQIVILDNDGTDAIVGTFAGLAEGAEIVVGSVRVRISYVGGTVIDNLPGSTPFDRLQFAGSGYTITGSGISLLGGITGTFDSGTGQIGLPITLAQDQTFSPSGSGTHRELLRRPAQRRHRDQCQHCHRLHRPRHWHRHSRAEIPRHAVTGCISPTLPRAPAHRPR